MVRGKNGAIWIEHLFLLLGVELVIDGYHALEYVVILIGV
jgi:hypothetical protein